MLSGQRLKTQVSDSSLSVKAAAVFMCQQGLKLPTAANPPHNVWLFLFVCFRPRGGRAVAQEFSTQEPD